MAKIFRNLKLITLVYLCCSSKIYTLAKSTKEGSKQLHERNYGQKVKAFFKRDILAIIASAIALYIWYQEKVTVEEHRDKLSKFYRYENAFQIDNVLLRNLELETNQTISNKKIFVNDSTFQVLYFVNVANMVGQENEAVFTLKVQRDVDKNIVTPHQNEKNKKNSQLQAILNTGNFDTISRYNDIQSKAFSKESTQLQNSSQSVLQELNDKLKQQLLRYQIAYLIAALFFTLDRIKKQRPKES